jgi:hypothetical protein
LVDFPYTAPKAQEWEKHCEKAEMKAGCCGGNKIQT